jgi:hypothetical protein
MARVSVSVFGVVVMVLSLGVPAPGAGAIPVPPNDFVIGGGQGAFFDEVSIDAHSDPLGGNATGSVSFSVLFAFRISGPVTCLAVDGTQAVIGFSDTHGFGPITVQVTDTSSVSDLFAASFGATDCSTFPPPSPLAVFLSGDIVVYDAPTKAQCLDGGWRSYTDATGQPFKSQGECIAFALGVA